MSVIVLRRLTFARVNSKATLRLPLDSLLPLVPSLLHPGLRSSRYFAGKTDSIIIQADDSRKQSDNVQGCFLRLHDMIREVAQGVIHGETSEAQKERVAGLCVDSYSSMILESSVNRL